MPSAREGPPQPSRPPASGVGGVHSILPRAGRRQPRGGRVAPRAGPSHGLRGQATTEPVVHFCAAAPVHIPAAVDKADYGFGLAALLKEVLGTSTEIAVSPEAVATVRPTSAVGDTLSATPTLLRVALVSPCFGASSLARSTVAHLCYPSDLAAEVVDRPALAHRAGSATRTLLEDNTDMVRGGALRTAPETYCRRSPAGGTIATRNPRTSHGSLRRPTLVNSSLFPCRPEYHPANRPAGIPSPGCSASALRSS